MDLHSPLQNDAYTVAHSPDADDIFMYYAIKFGWLSTPYKLVSLSLDIESLNLACLEGRYDISAISFGLYPLICKNYALLRTGLSFGEGYGPLLIKRRGTRLKKNFKAALSGAHTTNALLFRLKYPKARILYKNFLEIESAVLDGIVDAGVLIHEKILNFSSDLEVEASLWDVWLDYAKDCLPLPLGGMAIRRSIPLNRALYLEGLLARAVRIALRFRPLLSSMLLKQNLVRINEEELKTYLSLYANDHSCSLSDIQIKALDRLYELGFENGFYDFKLEASKYMLPKEYEGLRLEGL